MINKDTVEKMVDRLITQDENLKELNIWLRIFRDLSPALQEELAKNLEAELKSLDGSI